MTEIIFKRTLFSITFIAAGFFFTAPAWSDGTACFSPDGAFILTGAVNIEGVSPGSDFILWDTDSGKQIRVFKGHTMPVMSAVFSPDGTYILTAGTGADWSGEWPKMKGETKLWNTDAGNEVADFDAGAASSVCFSPDGKQVLTAGETTDDGLASTAVIQLWSIPDGKMIGQFTDLGSGLEYYKISTACFSPDGRNILFGGSYYDSDSGTFRADLRMIGTETGEVTMTFEGHTGLVTSAVFSRDGRRILSSSAYYPGDVYTREGEAILWESASGRLIRTIECGPSFKATLSPDGSRALAGGAMWDLSDGSMIFGSGLGTIYSPDGTYILSGFIEYNLMEGMYFSERNQLWRASDGELIRTLD